MSNRLIQLAAKKLQSENQEGVWVVTQTRWKDGFTTHVKTTIVKVEGSAGPLQVTFK